MSGTLRFEIKAEAFRRMTGMMAPGKDAPMTHAHTPEERGEAWSEWIRTYGACVNAVLAATEEFTEFK